MKGRTDTEAGGPRVVEVVAVGERAIVVAAQPLDVVAAYAGLQRVRTEVALVAPHHGARALVGVGEGLCRADAHLPPFECGHQLVCGRQREIVLPYQLVLRRVVMLPRDGCQGGWIVAPVEGLVLALANAQLCFPRLSHAIGKMG